MYVNDVATRKLKGGRSESAVDASQRAPDEEQTQGLQGSGLD